MIFLLLAVFGFLAVVMAASNIFRSATAGPPGQQGTLIMNQAGAPQVVWNLTYMSISFAGPTIGPNAKVTVYDGPIATGTAIFSAWLAGPTYQAVAGSSVGMIQKIDLPCDSSGKPSLQATPGNDMNILVNGFGNNACILNARFTDGIPSE